MKNTVKIVAALAAGCCLLFFTGRVRAQPAVAAVEQDFRKMLHETGAPYRASREKVVAAGARAVPYLRARAAAAESADEKLLAEIMVVRIENPGLCQQVEQIVAKAGRRGTVYDPKAVSFLALQSQFAQLDKSAVLPVLEILSRHEERPEVVAALARSLVVFRDRRAVAPLESLLRKDAPPVVQYEAVETLGRLRFAEAAGGLLSFFGSVGDAKLKIHIASNLARVGDEKTAPALRSLADQALEEPVKKALQDAAAGIEKRLQVINP